METNSLSNNQTSMTNKLFRNSQRPYSNYDSVPRVFIFTEAWGSLFSRHSAHQWQQHRDKFDFFFFASTIATSKEMSTLSFSVIYVYFHAVLLKLQSVLSIVVT